MSMESIYKYGSRVGIWRRIRLFRVSENLVITFAVAMALGRKSVTVE